MLIQNIVIIKFILLKGTPGIRTGVYISLCSLRFNSSVHRMDFLIPLRHFGECFLNLSSVQRLFALFTCVLILLTGESHPVWVLICLTSQLCQQNTFHWIFLRIINYFFFNSCVLICFPDSNSSVYLVSRALYSVVRQACIFAFVLIGFSVRMKTHLTSSYCTLIFTECCTVSIYVLCHSLRSNLRNIE